MSKLYKSGQCVEADPCRLKPADVEAFFINNNEYDIDESEPISTENVMDESAAEATPETIDEQAAAGEQDAGPQMILEQETGAAKPEETNLAQLFDVAGHIRTLLEAGNQAINSGAGKTESKMESGFLKTAGEKGFQEQAPGAAAIFDTPGTSTEESAPEVKKGVPKAFNPPKYQTDKAASVDTEASATAGVEMDDEEALARVKLLFEGAQKQAGEMTENARTQADLLLSKAQLQIKEQLGGAEQQAGSILSGAQREASQITSGASQQARAILQDAQTQAESMLESAKQKVLQLIENARKEAEAITGKAQQEASELRSAAKKEADDLVAAAAEEAIRLKNQAQQEGAETGRREGAAQIRQELAQNLAAALSLVNQAEEERLNRIRSSEPELLKLAVGIAEKIIGAELKLDPATQLEITREALTRITTVNNITIRVNPEDFKLYNENSALLQKAFSEPKMIRIEEDPGITPGNCFVETEHGNIDPRIKSQLEVIWAEISKAGFIS